MPGAGAHEDLTDDRRQTWRVDARLAVEGVVEILARQQARHGKCPTRTSLDVVFERILQGTGRRPLIREEPLLERAPPLLCRGATGHDDHWRLDERDVPRRRL